MLKTPVLFLVFNRPEQTAIVFNEIKKQKPELLFVHADGPRPGNESDIEKCLATRKIIEQEVDWECKLHAIFREENLGCGKGPASAITWFFKNVDEGIIIEEDCLPHPDFFGYCSELLEMYRKDERIMIIGATTYRDDYPCEYSYTFSHYGTMAAWATWKRVWDKFDYTLSGFTRDELKSKLKRYFYSRFEYNNWIRLYDWILKDGFKSYWDWQLHFTVFHNNGIAIRPNKNMISNIGTGPDASHTTYTSHTAFEANRPIYGCLPLRHPPIVKVDKKIDSAYYKKMYKPPATVRILQPVYETIFQGPLQNIKFLKVFLKYYRIIKIKFLLY